MRPKKTKIVATIGGASMSFEKLVKLADAGLDVARLNFSHGTHDEHETTIRNIRACIKKTNRPIAILQDLSGPKIRTGDLTTDTVTLKKGAKLVFTTDKIIGDEKRMSVTYKNLPKDIQKGARILLNDGNQELRVDRVAGTEIHCTIIVGGTIKPRRGVNLPGTSLSLSAVTKKDLKDLELGIKRKVDFVALSFVQSAKDIKKVKKILHEKKSKALVVAKIETTDAVEHIDEIIEAADAVMVARGDLAVEVGPTKVPVLQKLTILKCNQLGKPVIVATQMLESMITAPTPTRAEVSDVSNAILDGADAVMLSAETAIGKYPEEVVRMMHSISCEIESEIDYKRRVQRYVYSFSEVDIADAVTRHAAKASFDVQAKALIALTETGTTARMAARYRIPQPILVISPHQHTLNQSMLSFGVYPALPPMSIKSASDAIEQAKQTCLKQKIAKKGDKIVVLSGSIFGKSGETNTITVVTV